MWSTRWGGGTAAGGHRGASLPAPFYFSTALGPAARGFSLLFCPFRASGPGCFSEVQPALAHPPVFSCVGGRSDCGTLCKDHEKIKHPSLFQVIFKGAGKGVLKAMELRALCPFFVLYFPIATAVYGRLQGPFVRVRARFLVLPDLEPGTEAGVGAFHQNLASAGILVAIGASARPMCPKSE